MFGLFCFVLTVLASPFKSKSRLEAENAALRRQLVVLQRKVQGRIRLRSNDRWFLIQLYRWFPSILQVVTIVQPETLVRWHRAGFRCYWRWKSRPRGGRPQIETDLRTLIRRMSIENPLWGAPRIHGHYVARSTPDGYTLFVGSNGPVMLGPMTMPNPPYQWQQAFAPVSTLAVATNMLVVRPTLPVKSVAKLIEYFRKNPGKLTVAADSIASINHFMGELLKIKTGITWTEIHYRGNAPAVIDLMAGHVDVGILQLVDTAQQLKAGNLRALAILGPTRAPSFPDVPTIGEVGYPDVQGITFNGVFAPKMTPRAVIDKLSGAIRAALAKKEVVDRLASLGSSARGSTPEEFTNFLEQESKKWTDVMKQANIKVIQ